jgi:hypothetical protein
MTVCVCVTFWSIQCLFRLQEEKITGAVTGELASKEDSKLTHTFTLRRSVSSSIWALSEISPP